MFAKNFSRITARSGVCLSSLTYKGSAPSTAGLLSRSALFSAATNCSTNCLPASTSTALNKGFLGCRSSLWPSTRESSSRLPLNSSFRKSKLWGSGCSRSCLWRWFLSSPRSTRSTSRPPAPSFLTSPGGTGSAFLSASKTSPYSSSSCSWFSILEA